MSATFEGALPPAATAARPKRVVLAGNPNAGKTTLFNRLTGRTAKVGNYPGITVEVETGRWTLADAQTVELLDVPGSYSLSAHSIDERVAIGAIAGVPPSGPPDAVVVIADANELSRHLYLVLQVCELDVPVVVAVTMVDELERRGRRIDAAAMSAALGVPVVPVHAASRRGVKELGEAVTAVMAAGRAALPNDTWSTREAAEVKADIDAVATAVPSTWHRGDRERARALARWALLSADEPEVTSGLPRELVVAVSARRERAAADGRDLDAEIIGPRYAWIDERVEGFSVENAPPRASWTDRTDGLLLHPILGFGIFLAIMTVVFQSLFVGADPMIGWIEDAMAALGNAVSGVLPEGLFRDFVVNGLINGVGSVLVFLPQILLMFLFLGLLEDSGYMARVVFLMDRIMKSVGLHGRAFVPMMSGFACAVPAILSTRTMERRRDRLLTMMVVPLMTCSARLPVYGLLIAALYPVGEERPFAQGLLMAAMYLFAIVVSLLAAAVLGRTVLKGRNPPLLLQLPPYRRPQARIVGKLMIQRSGVFVREAGTVILVCTIALWVLLTFPRDPELSTDYRQLSAQATAEAAADPARGDAWLEERLAEIEAQKRGDELRHSYAGRLGHAIEPVIEPLGYDWKIGIGLIGSFAAREVFVATMAVVYGLDEESDAASVPLRERIRAETRPDGSRVYDAPTVLSLMVFFALACQCLSTLAVTKRESGHWGWPVFMFVYMTVLAWVGGFAVYQIGSLFV